MIKINSLNVENFMNISKADFLFNSSIIIISGKSGQGKSAVFDAIALCLSSKKRSATYSEYVKQGCTHSKIILDCIINGEPVNFNLQINLVRGTPYQMELTYRNQIYRNTEAEQILKSFDIEYYSDIIFSMQSDDYKDITQLSPTQRANYLSRLLNFDFNDQKEKLKKDIDNLLIQSQKIDNDISFFNRFIKKEQEEKEEPIVIKITEKDIKSYKEKIALNQEKIALYQKNQKSLELYNKQLADLKDGESKLFNEKNHVELLIAEVRRQQEKIESAEIELVNIRNGIKNQSESYKRTDELMRLVSIEIDSLSMGLQTFAKEEAELLYQCDQFKKLKVLHDEKTCPHCGQHTLVSAQTQFEKLAKDFKEFDKTLTIDNIDLIVLSFERQILDNRSAAHDMDNKYEEKRKQLEELTGALLEARIKEDSLSEQERKYKKILQNEETDILDFASMTKNLTLILEELEISKQQQKEVESHIKLISNNEDISALMTAITRYTSIIDNYENSIKQNDEIIKRNSKREESISDYKSKIETLNNQTVEIVSQRNILDEAYQILDKTLPNYMVVKACTSLQNEMNLFIQNIFPNYAVKLINSKKGCEFFYTKDSSILENDKRRNNSWINTKMSSGFEKALLTLSFKISLCQLYGLNIIIGDEIDGAGDDESSEKLFEQLIQTSIFDQIFLISHKKNICQSIIENTGDCTIYTAQNGQFTLSDMLD